MNVYPGSKRTYGWPEAKLAQIAERSASSWYRVTNLAGGGTEVMIYDDIGLYGVSAEYFVGELKNISGDVTVRINSRGGEIFDGVTIYNALKERKGKVTCIVDGLAASAASFIAMAGDRTVMAKTASMMIHDGHGLCVGNAKDMRSMADLLDQQSDIIAGIYADKAGGKVPDWRERMQNETWFNAAQALEAGLIDEIQSNEDEDLTNKVVPSITNSGRDLPEPVPEPEPEFTWDPELFKSAIREAAS
jgi:ATP-dependent protease ClpP protease subunit